jgi:MFS family permease
MSDLVPRAIRGRYFGRRSAVAAIVAIVVGYGGGLALDALEAWRRGVGFAAVYAGAALAGLCAYVAMRRQHHPSPRRGPDVPLRTLWREVWAKPDHRRIFVGFAAWNAALGVAVPFWAKYMARDLGMSTADIVAQGTVGSLVGVALLPAWGRVIDRVGTRPVLLANAVCIAGIPFLWLFARPGSLLPVWIDAFAVGVFWTGFNLTALNVPIAAAPKRGGFVFLGVFTALNGLAMGVACIVGGVAAQALGPGPHEVLGVRLATYQVVFLASGVLRVAALPLAWRLPDPKARSVVFLVSIMGTAVRQRLNTGWLFLTAPWRRRGS